MKAEFESIEHQNLQSFCVRRFEEKQFSAPYHFHPEIELTYIVKGTGKRYLGNGVKDYAEHDLVLIGENLPHCWKSATDTPSEINAISIVIQFKKDFLGKSFFELPELRGIASLLSLSKKGLSFHGDVIEEAALLMTKINKEQNSVKRIAIFLDILDKLANANEFTTLETQNIYENISAVEREKINKIRAYVVDHFTDAITIETAASLIGMTPFAFCKYFKKLTRKTFMETVIDYRIDDAVNQLLNSKKSVTEIAYACGFNDLSNFHKTFRNKKNCSPLNYRKAFL